MENSFKLTNMKQLEQMLRLSYCTFLSFCQVFSAWWLNYLGHKQHLSTCRSPPMSVIIIGMKFIQIWTIFRKSFIHLHLHVVDTEQSFKFWFRTSTQICHKILIVLSVLCWGFTHREFAIGKTKNLTKFYCMFWCRKYCLSLKIGNNDCTCLLFVKWNKGTSI